MSSFYINIPKRAAFHRAAALLLSVLLLLSACTSSKILEPSTVPQQVAQDLPAGAVKLTLLHTNDHHGASGRTRRVNTVWLRVRL